MNPTLATARLCLRLARSADAAPIAAFYRRNREAIQPWSPDRPPEFFTETYWADRIAEAADAAERGTGFRFWAYTETDDPVATVVLRDVRRGPNESAEIGYIVDAASAGRGIATEAAEAVIRFAFDRLRLHRLEATYMPANLASARILAKLGFTVEGTRRGMLLVGGRWEDHLVTSLINPDWAPLTEEEPA